MTRPSPVDFHEKIYATAHVLRFVFESRGKLVAHGFRSMARSWLADKEVSFDVAEMCLAHDVGSAASRAYQRSDFFESRKKIMEEWGEYVRTCAKSANFEF